MNIDDYAAYTAYLCSCVIKDETPSPIPKDISLEELFEFSCKHKLENMVYMALSKLDMSGYDKKNMGIFYGNVEARCQQRYDTAILS